MFIKSSAKCVYWISILKASTSQLAKHIYLVSVQIVNGRKSVLQTQFLNELYNCDIISGSNREIASHFKSLNKYPFIYYFVEVWKSLNINKENLW